MDLEHIDSLHAAACRRSADADDRERALATIPRLIARIRVLQGEGEPTHDDESGPVRELFRVRDARSGRMQVVFKRINGGDRAWSTDATDFDVKFTERNPKHVPAFSVENRRVHDDGVSWQCRRCRKLIAPDHERVSVANDRGQSLGEWCQDCVAKVCSQ